MSGKRIAVSLCVFALCVIISGVSYYSTYNRYNQLDEKPLPEHTEEPEKEFPGTSDRLQLRAAIGETDKINSDTTMVYKYYYEEDGRTEEVVEESPPYFLINMTLEELQNYYDDWMVQSFSRQEVVMQKHIEGKSTQRYIVGIHNGYVAVFYEEAVNGVSLREITETPVVSLSEEERQMLENGISIVGDENLYKILEDYSS